MTYSPERWEAVMSTADWREKYRLIEDGIRQTLATLAPGIELTTRQLCERMFYGVSVGAAEEAVGRVMKIAKHVPDIREARPEKMETGIHKGKTINRYVWSHRPYKAPIASSPRSEGQASPVRPVYVEYAQFNELVASVSDLRDQVQALKESVDALQIPTNIAAYL